MSLFLVAEYCFRSAGSKDICSSNSLPNNVFFCFKAEPGYF